MEEGKKEATLSGIEGLLSYLESLSGFELPPYRELPPVRLYMEQVLEYVNNVLRPLGEGDRQTITSFMVNNYVKARIIKEPEGKRYGKEQLGYLMAIAILKRSLSMTEIGRLLEMEGAIGKEKEEVYGFYRSLLSDLVTERTTSLAGKTKEVLEKATAAPEGEEREQALRDAYGRIALLAVRLAVRSAIDQTIARAMIASLGEGSTFDAGFVRKKEGEEEKEEERLSEREAKRLSERK